MVSFQRSGVFNYKPHIYIAKNITLLDILKFAIKRFLKLPQEKSNVQKKICKKIGMF